MSIRPSAFQAHPLRMAVWIAAILLPIACGDSTAPSAAARYLVTANFLSPIAGDPIIVTAQLVDANDQPLRESGRSVTWISEPGGGHVDPVTSVTGADGIASTAFTTDTIAGVVHRVLARDSHAIQGVTERITTVAGPPATYNVVPSTFNPVVGSTLLVSAQLGDQHHNATKVPGRVVSWSTIITGRVNGATGSFSSPISSTDADGIASVSFTIGTTTDATYQVHAVDDHAAGGISNQIVGRAGAVARYVVIPHVNDPPAGAEVVIAAQASDAYGNPTPINAVSVQWSMTGSGGSLNFATTRTNEAGVAIVYLKTATVSGATYTVSASDAAGNSGASPAITTVPQVSLASVSVVMGPSSSCGIAMDGNAWCWGANAAGGLGNGTTSDRGLPGKVSGNYPMTSLSAGAAHTCGVAAGAVLCWGSNDFGQLGNGSAAANLVPTPINSSTAFTTVSAGAAHTCAVATAGDVYCWGSGAGGRLGNGGAGTISLTPVKVAGGLSFAAVSAGVDHSCGITTAADAYCWGSNALGKLGDGSVVQASTPRLVAGGLKFTAISVGEQHSCGIAGGSVYCWGDHSRGQLGTGSPQSARNTPTAVASAVTFVAISAGGFHTCAIASDAKAYCWGDNSNGELGDGNIPFPTYRNVPSAVAGGLTFKSIAVGGGQIGGDFYYYYSSPGGHSCGVTTGGVTYCWGSNLLGELGISPAGGDTSTPTKVSGQP